MKKISIGVFFLFTLSVSIAQEVELINEDFENTSRDWNELEKDDHIRAVREWQAHDGSGCENLFLVWPARDAG